MNLLHKLLSSILLLSFLFTTPSTADIKSITIRSDNRPMILFQKFGFTHTGNVAVAVSDVSVTSTVTIHDQSRFGFFLLAEEVLIQVLFELQQNPNGCVLDSKYITLLFTFRDLSPQSSFNKSYPVTYPNEYSLFFANCDPQALVTMDVRRELYNTDQSTDAAIKDYLSDGLTQLPSLYFIFAIIYLCFLGFWICLCFINRQFVHQAHILMGALLTLKTITILCALMKIYYVKITGTPHGWSVPFQILNSVMVSLLLSAIILIGAGWPYSKPHLQEKGKGVLMIVIPLQVLATTASMVIGFSGPYIANWVTWNQVYLLTDFICWCAVIFSVVRSTRSFSKSNRNLVLFRLFCVVVIGYLLFTRIGFSILKTIGSYKQQWVWFGVEEMVSFVFCLVMFYMVRPVDDDGYYVVEDEGEEPLLVVMG